MYDYSHDEAGKAMSHHKKSRSDYWDGQRAWNQLEVVDGGHIY
jgi:hypothetical protein